MVKRTSLISASALSLLLFLLGGCSEYWWSRGQAASVDRLLAQADTRLDASLEQYSAKRPEVSLLAKNLRNTLYDILSRTKVRHQTANIAQALAQAEGDFMKLEEKVSVGSRPALEELAGELRGFSQRILEGGIPDQKAFGLLTARTFSLLATELSIPASITG